MENVFSADYAFAQDVMDEVETIVDRVGPLGFVKNIFALLPGRSWDSRWRGVGVCGESFRVSPRVP